MGHSKVTIPAVELASVPALVEAKFDELMEQYVNNKVLAETAEAERKRIGQELNALLTATGQTKIGHCEYVALKCNGRSGARLDERKLLEKGVDPEIIKECWAGGTSYTYVQVILRKEEI